MLFKSQNAQASTLGRAQRWLIWRGGRIPRDYQACAEDINEVTSPGALYREAFRIVDENDVVVWGPRYTQYSAINAECHELREYCGPQDERTAEQALNDYLNPEPVMPTPVTPVIANPEATLAKISVRRVAGGSGLELTIDASKLHEQLDAIGVAHSGSKYRDRPGTSFQVASTDFKLSTELFLTREYPVKVLLSTIYASPPPFPKIKRLAESGIEAIRQILEHYQPIDIQIDIQKKLVG